MKIIVPSKEPTQTRKIRLEKRGGLRRRRPRKPRASFRRQCLRCGKKFLGDSRFNRICSKCHATRHKSTGGLSEYRLDESSWMK